jgi:hypothetical protein
MTSVVADGSIHRALADTTIQNRSCYLVTLTMDKKVIERLGGFSPITLERKTIYKIIVDKKSCLPMQVIQSNNANNDLMRTVFTDLDENK